MIHVLFVCLGNICRSPMAEAVFRHQVKEAKLEHEISVDSAGTGDWHIGKPPHEGTRNKLTEMKINQDGMRARQVTAADFTTYDYVIAMDDQNVQNLQAVGAGAADRVIKLLDLLPDQPVRNVPDPYFTGNFDEVYELINKACSRLLEKVRAEHGIEAD
ncbi:low molecular weight protein-tyrosine-phosphatase [Marinicrinis sediminis]|uniref:protein-tyrosine-phosphatase n=1 Tax=Marinicrinis sediminis TaxID=1652465 RepID=A0ABW5RDS9_9BACL